MWPKFYKDYPVDTPMIKYQVEPGKGIIGCEMHEINGWGNDLHQKKRQKPEIKAKGKRQKAEGQK